MNVSALGFGCMRFPTTDGKATSGAIDEKIARKMLRCAIDAGVNYVDTAYPYHEQESEHLVGRVLKDGYRDRVFLATKMPVWLVEAPGDFDKYLNTQLARLQTDTIDFYLLHALDTGRWDKMQRLNALDWAEKARSDGRIRYIGFSFHDELHVFKKIVDDYEGWDFCQIQYNYMDIDRQAGEEGLRYAADRGLGVVVMEPLRGGRLSNPPESVHAVFRDADERRTPTDWALQWLWDQPEVSVVLSGMSTIDQVAENVASADRSYVGSCTEVDKASVRRARERFLKASIIPCTNCGYCVPCDEGVKIPQNFQLYNDGAMFDDHKTASWWYEATLAETERASACIACGDCEQVCPQKIEISEWMKVVHNVLGEGRPYVREL